jgi:NAD(P)-dependent dehydrogenase (short-subunit alcohol dehydrogenase family)
MTLHNTADLKLVDGDIGIEETAKHVLRTAMQNFGTVDLLVNNAGVFIPKMARRGYDVTVFERDSEPPPGSPEEAWQSWERRAPSVVGSRES